MAGARNRRAAPPVEVQRRALRWAMLAAGVAVVIGITAIALIALTSPDDPALEVGDWSVSRGELRGDLEAVEGNAVYRTLRDQAGSPLRVREADGGAFTTEFVAEILNERLTFRLAELAVAERGGQVTDEDRAASRDELSGKVVGVAQIGGSKEATLEKVLEGFDDYRPTLEEGLATVSALRRLVDAELPPTVEPPPERSAPGEGDVAPDGVLPDDGDVMPDGALPDDGAPAGAGGEQGDAPVEAVPGDEGAEDRTGEDGEPALEGEGADVVIEPAEDAVERRVAEVDAELRTVLVEVAAREGVTVPDDLGVFDPATATVLPAAADADLEEVDPTQDTGGRSPAPQDGGATDGAGEGDGAVTGPTLVPDPTAPVGPAEPADPAEPAAPNEPVGPDQPDGPAEPGADAPQDPGPAPDGDPAGG